MKERGVVLNLHYIPVHRQPYYEKLGFRQGDFPHSEKYYEEAFTLPLYYSLANDEQDYISNPCGASYDSRRGMCGKEGAVWARFDCQTLSRNGTVWYEVWREE